jgi:hypothetical protein
MNEQPDELDEIFVDKNEPAEKKILVEMIKPFATIDNEGSLNFSEKYHDLSFWKKIIVYLTCKKAMKLRGICEKEGAGPKEISEGAQISLDSAKNISREKKLASLVRKDSEGYFIPNYKLRDAKKELIENEKE